jgi:exodeoxyribonuclease V alpha subunit
VQKKESPVQPGEARTYQFLEGTLERLTFHSEDNGYTVARLIPKGKTYEVTVVGTLSGVNVGELLHLQGNWTSHPQYGRQFEVQAYSVHYPATIEGLRKYLGSGLVRGIGKVNANRIVDHFGLEVLDIIESEPHRLREVSGIGAKRAGLIARAWEDQKLIKEIMIFLQGHGVSTSLAVKIFKQYGEKSIEVVRSNPYQLARDVYGIGFRTADKIALQMGMALSAPERLQAGLLFCLSQLSDEGHCFATRDQLLNEASPLLEVGQPECEAQLDELVAKGSEGVFSEDMPDLGEGVRGIFLPPFYMAERGVASKLRRIQLAQRDRLSSFQAVEWDKAFAWLAAQSPIQLTGQQMEAVKTALTQKVSILTGGPGTGKSTITGSIIRILQARKASVLLAAPTGRAAKRLSEATGLEAKTIHRLLEFKPGLGNQFLRDKENPLDTDLVIIDETSMVDILLMNHLLGAIDQGSHVLLVGDVDQLPSVGPGNVLRDLIASEVAPVTRLDTIFRQAEDSYIIVNAHRINQGEMPLFSQNAKDFFLFSEEDPQKAADRVIDLVTTRIPQKFGFNPASDIQVLSPMHRGSVGVAELNQRLQEGLNPAAPDKLEFRHGQNTFREGDRVMQIRNDYDRQVFNGDMGKIAQIDLEDKVVQIDFEGRLVPCEFTQMDEVVHAYAVSIHKSQGSEFPVVVIPLLVQHYMMLQRNLVYTAVTRARKLAVLVGSKKAIHMAVRNNRIASRNTRLAKRLQEYVLPRDEMKNKGYQV